MKAGGGASKMRASSRAHRYPWQPPPGTITLRNSVEILTNLYTYHSQRRGREGECETAAQMHNLELEIARPPRASMHHLKLSEDRMLNRAA